MPNIGYIVSAGGWRMVNPMTFKQARKVASQYKGGRVIRIADNKVVWQAK